MLELSDWGFKTAAMKMLRSLRGNLFKIVTATTYLIMHVYVYFGYFNLSAINDRKDRRDGRQELDLFCYYKIHSMRRLRN